MILARIITLVIGYVCGLFITGYFYGKTQQVDIRTMGSGNAGATNSLRTLGVKAGIVTLLGDCGKTMFAMFLAWLIFHNSYPDGIRILELYAGLGTTLGHNFPVTMKFKGGKGVACTAGLIIFFCPQEVPVCLLVFVLAVVCTKYVSLGSVLVFITFVAQTIVFGKIGILGLGGEQYITELYAIVILLAILGIFQHRANIARLLSGTENKLSLGSKK